MMKYVAGGFVIRPGHTSTEVNGHPTGELKEIFTDSLAGILGVLPKAEFVDRENVITTWGPAGYYEKPNNNPNPNPNPNECKGGYHYTIATKPINNNDRIQFKVGCAKAIPEPTKNCQSYENKNQHLLNEDLRHVWYNFKGTNKLIDSGWPKEAVPAILKDGTPVETNDSFKTHYLTAQFNDEKKDNKDTTVCMGKTNVNLTWDTKHISGTAELKSITHPNKFDGKFWIVDTPPYKNFIFDTGSGAAVRIDKNEHHSVTDNVSVCKTQARPQTQSIPKEKNDRQDTFSNSTPRESDPSSNSAPWGSDTSKSAPWGSDPFNSAPRMPYPSISAPWGQTLVPPYI
jgi:hypothetical protein